MASRAGAFFGLLFFFTQLQAQIPVVTETNVTIRVMACNLTSGNGQSYETPGINILKGLKPDIVAMQEFRYNSSSSAVQLRALVDTAFGTNYNYFCEAGSYNIPNGIVSRFPILTNNSWVDSDTGVNDRGFAWAKIGVPGTNPLYVVSVHLKASSGAANATRRAAEAAELKDLIQTNLPAGAWIIVAGDMNLFDESEAAINTFKTFLSDSPVPVDVAGDSDTNAGRDERYDRVLPSFSLTNRLVPVVLPSHTFPNGLVFDSRVYTPLSDAPPVVSGDSGASNMQHMGVVKAFSIPYSVTNFVTVDSPELTFELPGILRWQGLSNVDYTVQAVADLADTNWLTIGTASSPTTDISFTNEDLSGSQMFFRVTYP